MPRTKSENNGQATLRLPLPWLTRADVLLDRLSIPGMHVERADVLRAAILRGLEILEAEHGVKPPGSEEPVTRTRRRGRH